MKIAILILGFSLFTGWSTDISYGQKDLTDPHIEKNVPWKAADVFLQNIISAMNKFKASESFSPSGKYFFLPLYNGIYWAYSDIVINPEEMIPKTEKPGGPIRPGNIKQMFSIMNL